jgi:Na+-transporting methylmalonyl-CoA/oxaloacetate decarboxylase gamma subunit
MSDLQYALYITALGMGLVFGAILVLWALMVALTALVRDREHSSAQSEDSAGENPAPGVQDQRKALAAAVAVTLALAEQGASRVHPLSTPATAIVSAWQLGMRTRQMTQKGNPYKKERK